MWHQCAPCRRPHLHSGGLPTKTGTGSMLKERPDRDSISRGDDLMDWNPMGHGNLRLPWRSDVAVSILRPAEEKRKKKANFPKVAVTSGRMFKWRWVGFGENAPMMTPPQPLLSWRGRSRTLGKQSHADQKFFGLFFFFLSVHVAVLIGALLAFRVVVECVARLSTPLIYVCVIHPSSRYKSTKARANWSYRQHMEPPKKPVVGPRSRSSSSQNKSLPWNRLQESPEAPDFPIRQPLLAILSVRQSSN